MDFTWKKLNGGRKWLHAENGAYIYLNSMDNHWWIDEPSGRGVFIAPEKHQMKSQNSIENTPPSFGWRYLGTTSEALPSVEIIA